MKISIITVCYNSEKYLEETIRSVTAQTYRNIEYIVIDGKSSDGTLDIINRYKSFIAHFLSEEDTSMYDALNKGLSLATGDYILNLNSDDVLYDAGLIEEVVNKLGDRRPDAFFGNIVKDYGFAKKKIKLFSTTFSTLLCSRHGSFIPHPVFFVSNKANKELGGYDLNYKYASDFDYILRFLKTPYFTIIHLPVWCVVFRVHSASHSGQGKILQERLQILSKFEYQKIPLIRKRFLFFWGWSFYVLNNISSYISFYQQKFLKRHV